MPPSLATIQGQLENQFLPTRDQAKSVKIAIGQYVNADPQLGPVEIKQGLSEDLPPSVLYSDEMLSGSHVIYRILRDFFERTGASTYSPHANSNRIVWGIVKMIYTDTDDQEDAYRRLAALRSGNAVERGSGTERQDVSSTQESSPRLATNIALRFKNEEHKYSGTLAENYLEYLNNYLDAAKQYRLNEGQKLEFFIEIFTGEAKRHYRNYVDGIADTFAEANRMMQAEFSSKTRQNRVKKQLDALRVSKLVAKGKPIAEALEFVREEITKKSDQGPPTHRDEAHRVEYMKKAVLGMPWAKETLTRCTNADPAWTLKDLHGHLDSAYLQEEEEAAARAADRLLQDMPANAALPGIFYQGQGIYGRERNPGSRSSAPNGFFKRPSDVDRFGNKRQCWNCGSDNHLIRDCRKPRNMMEMVAKRASKAKSKDELKQVLYEVIVQTEDAIFENENEGAATFWQTNLSDSDGRDSSDSDCDSSINKSPPPDTLYQGLQDIQRRQHANISFSAVNPEDF